MAWIGMDESMLNNGGYLEDPWQALNLDYPGLENIKALHTAGRKDEAALSLLQYYRERGGFYPGGDEQDFGARLQANPAFKPQIDVLMREANETRQNVFWCGRPRTRPDLMKSWPTASAIDWNFIPSDDLEWTYNLNRHGFWVSLTRAWRLTGDPTYIEAFCDQIDAWISKCPRPTDYSRATHLPAGEAWRVIEVGIRGMNWLRAISLVRLSAAMRPQTWLRILASLAEQAEFIKGLHLPYTRQGNWGVLATQGWLHIALLLPELAGAEGWRRVGLARMEDMARLQMNEDGYHWETTPGYHHVVAALYAEIYGLCKLGGLREPSFLPMVRQALWNQIALAQPDLHRPMLSDTDSQNTDIRINNTFAAMVLEDPELKFFAHDQLDYDNLWSWGFEADEQYGRLPKPTTTNFPPSHYLPQSGFFVMRSDWKRDARCLIMVGSPVMSAHRHDDIGHIELHANGRHFLSDSSFHSYMETDPLRRQLKESPAHNTLVVDDLPASVYLSHSQWVGSRPLDSFWRTAPQYEYGQIAQTGYLRLPSPVLPTRRVFYIKSDGDISDYWLLSDQIETSPASTHTYQQRFHFASPAGGIKIDAANREIYTDFGVASANLHLVAAASNARTRLEIGIASPIAFSTTPIDIGIIEYEQTGNLFAPVLMWPVAPNVETVLPRMARLQGNTLDFSSVPLDASYVLELDFGSGRRDLFAFQLRGACVTVVDDNLFFGEIGLLRQRPGVEPEWQRVR